MVGMRMGADDGIDVAASGLENALDVGRNIRAGVDHHIACLLCAHNVGIGAGASHHARVGCGQPHHMLQELHRPLMLPAQLMHDLAVRADHGQLAKRRFMLHEACFFALHQTSARAARPQRLLICASAHHIVDHCISC